jgi:predicted RNA-binding protein with PIN domain
VTVIYSRIGEKADSVIKRVISSGRSGWIVVTSDRDIAHYAWSKGSVPVSAEDFVRIIEQHVQGYPSAEEYEDKVPQEPRRKGSSRKLSKKEKAIRRALIKL